MALSVKTEEAKPRTYEDRLAAIEEAAAEFRRNATDLSPVTKEAWDAINDDVD